MDDIDPDRRGCVRVSMDSRRLPVSLPSLGLSGHVVDIGGGGAAIDWDCRTGVTPFADRQMVFSPAGYSPFSMVARVVALHHRVEGLSVRVGVRFGQTDDLETLGAIARFVADRHVESTSARSAAGELFRLAVDDSEHVQRLLTNYVVNGARRLRVVDASEEEPQLLEVLGWHPVRDGVLIVDAPAARLESLRERGRCTLGFSGAQAENRFESMVGLDEALGATTVLLPRRMTKQGFRASTRTRPVARMRVSVIHPRLPDLVLLKEIVDIGSRGLSFLTSPQDDALFLGERVMLDIEDGAIWAEGVVRSYTPSEHSGQLICGVEIVRFPGRSHGDRWRRTVFQQTFPAIALGEGQTAPKAWRVLETSRYLDETTPALEDQLRQSYQASWGRTRRRSPFDRFILALEGQQPIGTISVSLIYPGAWLMHQMGIDAARRKASRRLKYEACRDLFVGITNLVNQLEDFRYLIVYFDAEKPFNQLVYVKFLQQLPDLRHCALQRFDILKCHPQRYQSLEERGLCSETRDDLVISEAGSADSTLDMLLHELGKTEAAVVRRALSLEPGDLLLETFSRQYAKRGFSRLRRVFVARDPQGPIAALVAEEGGEGVNVFNLFNTCFFVSFREDGTDERIRECLLDRALKTYRESGVREVLLLETPQGRPGLGRVESFLGEPIAGLRWVAQRDIIPAWMDYLHDLFRGLADKRDASSVSPPEASVSESQDGAQQPEDRVAS